jgi:hypothetical protein
MFPRKPEFESMHDEPANCSPGRHAEIVPVNGCHYVRLDGQVWSRHDSLEKAEGVRNAIVERWAAEYDRRAAEYERLGLIEQHPTEHHDDTLSSVALVIVNEPDKCLFFMRRWAEGTGDAHILRWDRYEQNKFFVNFYRSDGTLKALIARANEFP